MSDLMLAVGAGTVLAGSGALIGSGVVSKNASRLRGAGAYALMLGGIGFSVALAMPEKTTASTMRQVSGALIGAAVGAGIVAISPARPQAILGAAIVCGALGLFVSRQED